MPPARRVVPPHMDADDDGTFDSRYYTEDEVDALIDDIETGAGAVDSVNGATGAVVLDADDISDDSTTNKFTTSANLTKLSGIATGAEVNVQSDWDATSGDAFIANKPTLGTAAASDTDDFAAAAHTHTASDVTDFDTEVGNNTAVAANTAARHSHSNKSVLDATTASFTTADETKLDGIEASADVTDATNVAAAGAVMESDTSTANMSFVVDEDDLSSDSATKVPTQQSVKAYVDANSGGASDLDDLSDVTITSATSGQVLKYNGTAWVNDDDLTGEGGTTVTSVNEETGDVVLDADDIDDTSTTNKFTTAADISKLAGIESGAEVNDVNSVNGETGTVVLDADDISDTSTTNKFVTAADITKLGNLSGTNTGDQDLSDYFDTTADTLDDITTGTTNVHFTATEKTKLSGIASGAEVNVQSDWNAASGDAQILNKPTLGTAAAADTGDFATAAQGALADSATQPGDLADVATSGSYTDLTSTPTIPDALADLDTTVTGAQLNSLKTKVDGIETGADVTDATNVDAAGAVMLSDTSTSGMGFVVDEDAMTSDSATKVPTQQSVKAYVDANAGGSVAWGDITGTLADQTDLDTALDGKSDTGHTHTQTFAITFVMDGGGSAITTGAKGDLYIPFACTITGWNLMTDTVGTFQVDIWKDTFGSAITDGDSITASDVPVTGGLSAVGSGTSLTGWTTSIAAGDQLRINVDTASGATMATLALTCTRAVS